ncbi:MAG TPA: cytochrome c [Burkholderiaceae bacterium]|nr:cytochrome c [Burkholderiaceae bacterium]
MNKGYLAIAIALAALSTSAARADDTPYKVVNGNQVDAKTLQGWRTWRQMACERCHGANQEGLVGPSLVDDLKTMSRADFDKCVLEGRVDKGMPNFGTSKTVTDNLDGLYAFLKGRSDGAIKTGRLEAMP